MDVINFLIGNVQNELNTLQIGIRTIIIYFCAIIMVRIGNKRYMGKSAAFDSLLGVIIGSVVSRAINGTAEIVPSIVSGLILVAVHWLFGAAAFHSKFFGNIIKGGTSVLVRDGKIFWDSMKKSHITKNDLEEEMRLETSEYDIEKIKEARLERNGSVSFIKNPEIKIVEVKVEQGVQMIRLKIE
jgi:uncharacterized membrane protein YcaP (DUF421 family)